MLVALHAPSQAVIACHSRAAESCVTPSDEIRYYWSGLVFGLISNCLENVCIGPTIRQRSVFSEWTVGWTKSFSLSRNLSESASGGGWGGWITVETVVNFLFSANSQ